MKKKENKTPIFPISSIITVTNFQLPVQTIMAPTLDTLKGPIGLRSEMVATETKRIRIKQHAGLSGLAACDFTVTTATTDSDSGSSPSKLLSIEGQATSLLQRRKFRDGSGLPLFEVARKVAGATWFVHLPEDYGEPIATITPRWHALKDKFDVYFDNAAGDGEKIQLETRGQDIWKLRTNVYLGEQMVMTAKRTDKMSVYLPGKALEWDVDVAQGMDISIVRQTALSDYSGINIQFFPGVSHCCCHGTTNVPNQLSLFAVIERESKEAKWNHG